MNDTGAVVRVLAPGALTTLQDGGREGWRHLGVARAGALDPEACAVVNRLVGNPAEAAVLELTLHGPTLRWETPVRIALYGAQASLRFEDTQGNAHTLPCARPLDLPAGTLRIGALCTATTGSGLRAWLAFAGGIDAPCVLGSRSTDLRGGFGGFEGRALRSGDTLRLHAPAVEVDPSRPVPHWWVAADADLLSQQAIRYVASSHPDAALLAGCDWRVDPRSDRQGLRLSGELRTPRAAPMPEQVSAPVAPGTIQLPADGQPIVLLADAQTVGGYPRLGYAISADLPRLAQYRPGERLRFEQVTPEQARALRRERSARLARLLMTIDDRLRG